MLWTYSIHYLQHPMIVESAYLCFTITFDSSGIIMFKNFLDQGWVIMTWVVAIFDTYDIIKWHLVNISLMSKLKHVRYLFLEYLLTLLWENAKNSRKQKKNKKGQAFSKIITEIINSCWPVSWAVLICSVLFLTMGNAEKGPTL